jgi:hypothetical protein
MEQNINTMHGPANIKCLKFTYSFEIINNYRKFNYKNLSTQTDEMQDFVN